MIPRRPHPIWHELATPEELSRIDKLDRSIADLRRRRQALVNRAKLRTHVWAERHGTQTTPPRRQPAGLVIGTHGRTRHAPSIDAASSYESPIVTDSQQERASTGSLRLLPDCTRMIPDRGRPMFAVQDRASTYRLKAENCFSIACSTVDPVERRQWLDAALRSRLGRPCGRGLLIRLRPRHTHQKRLQKQDWSNRE